MLCCPDVSGVVPAAVSMPVSVSSSAYSGVHVLPSLRRLLKASKGGKNKNGGNGKGGKGGFVAVAVDVVVVLERLCVCEYGIDAVRVGQDGSLHGIGLVVIC